MKTKLNFLVELKVDNSLNIIAVAGSADLYGMVDVSCMVDYSALKMEEPEYLSIWDCQSIAMFCTGYFNKPVSICDVVKNIIRELN